MCDLLHPQPRSSAHAADPDTDAKALFDALQFDAGALANIADTIKKTSQPLGYNNGYWLIIMQ